MTRRKQRKRRLTLFILVLFIIVCAALYFFIFMFNKGEKSKVLYEIKGYGYTIEKRDTQLMKDTFTLLKTELSKDKIDYEKYAEYLAKLYIIDLYTINNKNSKYDIGGVEYIYPKHQESYKSKVQDTMYRYVQEKSNRKQKLPEVSSISIKNIEESKFTYQKTEYDAYEMDASWKYKKDLGYDNKANIVIVKIDDKLYIAESGQEKQEAES